MIDQPSGVTFPTAPEIDDEVAADRQPPKRDLVAVWNYLVTCIELVYGLDTGWCGDALEALLDRMYDGAEDAKAAREEATALTDAVKAHDKLASLLRGICSRTHAEKAVELLDSIERHLEVLRGEISRRASFRYRGILAMEGLLAPSSGGPPATKDALVLLGADIGLDAERMAMAEALLVRDPKRSPRYRIPGRVRVKDWFEDHEAAVDRWKKAFDRERTGKEDRTQRQPRRRPRDATQPKSRPGSKQTHR